MLSYLMDVDFLLVSTHYVADLFAQKLVKGYPDPVQKLLEMNSTSWNYVQEFSFELRAIK